MLKLTVKPGDAIKIDDEIVITITQSTYNRIQMEIDAPPQISISREKREVPDTKILVVKGNRMV